jgi:hypothetical protein
MASPLAQEIIEGLSHLFPHAAQPGLRANTPVIEAGIDLGNSVLSAVDPGIVALEMRLAAIEQAIFGNSDPVQTGGVIAPLTPDQTSAATAKVASVNPSATVAKS